jgi:hypothetical protein
MLTREEKKELRMQIIKLLDSCGECKYRRKEKASITVCPNCSIGEKLQRLGNLLIVEEPKRQRPLRQFMRWTKEEEFYLWHHQNVLPLDKMAKRLNRSTRAVYLKLWKLRKKGGIIHAN